LSEGKKSESAPGAHSNPNPAVKKLGREGRGGPTQKGKKITINVTNGKGEKNRPIWRSIM